MLLILNTPIIYHATPSMIMHELCFIITHIFHYHELQRNLHLPGLAHKVWGLGGMAPRILYKYTLLKAVLVNPFHNNGSPWRSPMRRECHEQYRISSSYHHTIT